MDAARCFEAARNIEVAPPRRAAADKNRIVAFADEALQTIDAPFGDKLPASRQSVADLLVDYLVRQAKLWNLAAHHAAGARVGIEHDDLIADRCQIARDGQRRRAGADAGDALAVSLQRCAGEQGSDVLLVIGGDALQPADRNRLLLKPAPAAGRLAGTIASASQNSREHIRLPIDHIGAVVIPRCDLANIFGDWSMRRASPLTVNHLVEVAWIRDIRRLHDFFSFRPFPQCEHVRMHTYASLRTKFLKSGWESDKRSVKGFFITLFPLKGRARAAKTAQFAPFKRGKVPGSR